MEKIIELNKGEFWKRSCPKGGSLEITCLEGALWVTQEGDEWDYCLEDGKSFITNKPRTTLLEALEKTQFKMIESKSIPFTGPRNIHIRGGG
jgi:hypothetical protein